MKKIGLIASVLAGLLVGVSAQAVSSLPSRPFGVTKYGESAKAYVLRGKGGLVMEVTDYGGRVSRLLVPDAKGELVDVTIGFDSVKGWDDSTRAISSSAAGR